MTRSHDPPLGVRRAAPRDLDAIVALWGALAGGHAELDPAFAVRRGDPEALREELRRSLTAPDSAVWVWASQAGVGGFCAARIRRAPTLAVESGRGEIDDLYVRPELRSQGVGAALVRAAFDWMHATGIERVEVRVSARNQLGQAFWRGLGFGAFVDVLQRRL